MSTILSPLSADSRLDSQLQARMAELVALLEPHLSTGLRAVVLGGSVGRGAGFGLLDGDRLTLLSDLDLYLLHERPAASEALREEIAAWSRGTGFFELPPDVAIVDRAYFSSAQRTLNSLRLQAEGRVILGDARDIFDALKSSDPKTLSRDDAHRLLLNRCAESFAPEREDADSLRALLHRSKCYLDVPLAWMAMTGWHDVDRERQLDELASCLQGQAASGLQRVRGIVAARGRGVVTAAGLSDLVGSIEDLREWCLPFAVASFALATDGEGRLEFPADTTELERVTRRWLRRRPIGTRLRHARRWAGIAPKGAILPWWIHGVGGVGVDRVLAAGCLRFFGLANWEEPLQGLLPGHSDGHAAYDLWSAWLGRRVG